MFNSNFISALEVDEGRNLIVVLTRQNQLVLYALDTLEEVVRIHQKRENQWIAVAPSGEYAALLAELIHDRVVVQEEQTIVSIESP